MLASDGMDGLLDAPGLAGLAGRPLAGMRVVELCHVAAGPFAGMLLADLGADVIKVEPPAGDQMRSWPPLRGGDGSESFSYNFASLNRNKRSVVADLKDEADLARVRALVAEADILLENYRPGVLDRLGLGFDDVTSGHPGLVYCSISGYGLSSPYRDQGAFDVVIQGMSGLMSVTGEPDGEPVKCGVPVGDFVAGLYAALTIVASVPRAKDSGKSVHLDCPMLDCLIATAALQVSEYWGTGVPPGRLGSAHPRNAPYQAFRARDGYFTLAAGNDRLWAQVCRSTGLQEHAADPRFLTQRDRAAHQDELVALLAPVLAGQTVAYWLEEFGRTGVPAGPIYDFEQILNDKHAVETGLVQELDVPVIGPTQTVAFPVRIDGQRLHHRSPPPQLDEHAGGADWGAR